LAESLWEDLGHSASILHVSWPVYDPAWIGEETIEVVVQINGKIKSKFNATAGTDEALLKETALLDPKVIVAIGGALVKKIFVIQGRLINIVI
jgi:leucyl-tRNA synthetase